MQSFDKHVSTIQAVFSAWSVRRLYSENKASSPKLCRQQAEVIQNHDNENVRNIGQDEARHKKYKRLKLGVGQAYDRSSD
jgi:hypothetical protein